MRNRSFLPSAGRRLCGLAATLALCGSVYAGQIGVTVSNVQLGPAEIYPGQQATLTYDLGGTAFFMNAVDGVKVEFLSGSTVAKSFTYNTGQPGATRGANSLTFKNEDLPPGGPYTVRVTPVTKASVTTTKAWTDVSDPADGSLYFNYPRGVTVNKISGSPYRGRIYVTEGDGGNAGGRTTVDGVYVYNPDLSNPFAGPRLTSNDIGIYGPWGGTENSPFRPYVAPDGNVYINDASDGHGGLFVADPDLTPASFKSMFPWPDGTTITRDSYGTVTTPNGVIYGSVDSTWIEGTGASRVMYNTQEDIPIPDSGRGLTKYEIGTTTSNYDTPPSVLVSNATSNWYSDMVKDSQGNFYVVSQSTDDARKYDANGTQIATLPSTGASYTAIALDEANNKILISTTDGRVIQTDKSFSSTTDFVTGLGNNVMGVAIDNEGWVLVADQSDDLLHYYAPAGTYNVGANGASAAATVKVSVNPVPGDISPLGPTGLFTGPNGGKYGDGKLTMADAVVILRVIAGLDKAP